VSGAGLAVLPARAQVFGPPMTVFGSVTDSAGAVPEGLPVQAFVGDRVCGKGRTQFTGDGESRVTVYFADVVSREQTSGCGSDGAVVRIQVGDRFAMQTGHWKMGPVQLDLTFGDATPAAIPTFTPAARTTRPPATPDPASSEPAGSATPTANSPVPAETGVPATPSATPTLRGGLLTSASTGRGSGGSGGDDGGGGFPVWAAVVLVLGALATVGGGVGFAMARTRRDDDGEPSEPGG
jgi:hypothetical protein